MKIKELRTAYWKKTQTENKPRLQYDEVLDTLFVYFSMQETDKIITHFVDEHVAFLYRYSDKEIVGMRIEYFKKVFLPKTAEKKQWTLSETGEELNGIHDLKFKVEVVEIPETPTAIHYLKSRQYTVPKPLEKGIRVEPVFA